MGICGANNESNVYYIQYSTNDNKRWGAFHNIIAKPKWKRHQMVNKITDEGGMDSKAIDSNKIKHILFMCDIPRKNSIRMTIFRLSKNTKSNVHQIS